MNYFIPMLCCDLLIPVIMIVAGYLMFKHPPKSINNLFGYRTAMSKKNNDTWNFAHHYCGRLWLIAGVILLILSAAAHLPFIHSETQPISILSAIVLTVQLIILVCTIIPVERALKKTFDANGNRR